MIHADIHGKTGVPEDVLTSCCLGMLRLLPDDNLIELLALAHHLDGRRLDLTGLDRIDDLEFWPWLRDGGSPDAIATLCANFTSRRAKIVIEVKHGAEKSGGNEDQLAKYYTAAMRQYKNHDVLLIYLTHHRDMPVGDLEASLACLTNDAQIYWLNWYDVVKWCGDKLHRIQPSLVEYRILLTINNYLSLKGYRRFEKLDAVHWGVISSLTYTRNYFEIYNSLESCFNTIYKRTYQNQQALSTITCFTNKEIFQMDYSELVTTLKSTDSFYKNLLLMFDDLVSLVREKAYCGTLRDLTGPENSYGIWNANNSEYRRLWVFNHDGLVRFVEMLVVTSDDHLKANNSLFKGMCVQLARDPKFPMLLIYGTFEPRDSSRFNNDNNVRRHWILNATLIDIIEKQSHSDISQLHFGDTFTLESNEGTDSYWCEKGKFVICDLTTITDTTKLSDVADRLLKLNSSNSNNAN